MTREHALKLATACGLRSATAPSGMIGDYMWGEPNDIERLVAAARAEGFDAGQRAIKERAADLFATPTFQAAIRALPVAREQE